MTEAEECEVIEKREPMAHGRTDLRKRKPKRLAVINENCTGCSGSPACVEYCPVEACMFWVPDEDTWPGWFAKGLVYVEIVMGWLLSLLAVAGLSGIIKSD